MSHCDDLTSLLRSWPADPDRPLVRIIRTADGRSVLQRRIPMGIMQMELDGRPDGERPRGYPNLLEAFRTQLRTGAVQPTGEDLSDAEEEASLYLQRAAALAQLDHWDAVLADTAHVRALASILGADRLTAGASALAVLATEALILQVRTEVARALRESAGSQALAVIDRGLAELSALLAGSGSIAGPGRHVALALHALRTLRATLVPKLPSSQREELKARLEAAIRSENFELAAILRDELRQLGS